MGELCLNLPRSVVETGCKSELKPIWMLMRHILLQKNHISPPIGGTFEVDDFPFPSRERVGYVILS